MNQFKNAAHNEVAEAEQRLGDLYSEAIELSNWLYELDPQHPLLDEISPIISAIEVVDFEAPYEEAKARSGESWWEEADYEGQTQQGDER